MKVAPKAWLTTLPEVRERYAKDPFCSYRFTVSAMGDLMRLLKYSNRRAWFKNLPKIPVLLVAGENDPVGNYGKGVREVEKRLKKFGHTVKTILYKDARHEILNDFCYDEVKKDILEFIG